MLNKVNQDLKLGNEYLRKKYIRPYTQGINAHWDKLYSNSSYWNSSEEAATGIIHRHIGQKYKNPYKIQLIR